MRARVLAQLFYNLPWEQQLCPGKMTGQFSCTLTKKKYSPLNECQNEFNKNSYLKQEIRPYLLSPFTLNKNSQTTLSCGLLT